MEAALISLRGHGAKKQFNSLDVLAILLPSV